MLFNSLAFVFFLPIVLMGFYLLPVKWRSVFLLLASYYFYFSWSYWMGLLLMATTVLDWWIGLKIASAEAAKRKAFLILSLIINLGLLAGFKYFGLFDAVHRLFGSVLDATNDNTLQTIAIPIGISFYTFQSLSYVFDVYFRKISAEKNILQYALFVAFFPQLVAGPIERYQHLTSQFAFKIKFSNIDFKWAIQKIIYGYFKKLVIADRLGIYVESIYNTPQAFSAPTLVLAGLAFSIQVVCDFSGYTDIASGVAKLFGVDLMLNFKRPLLAKSTKAFWQRHNISLMHWFRDYVYFPLGGNKKGALVWVRNIFIVFLLSGLWHGHQLNLLLWGFSTALVYIIEHYFMQYVKLPIGIKRFLSPIYFLLITALLLSVLRNNNLDNCVYFFQTVFSSAIFQTINWRTLYSITTLFSFSLSFLMVIIYFMKEIIDEHVENQQLKVPIWFQNSLHFLLLLLIFVAGNFSNNLFIYFQF